MVEGELCGENSWCIRRESVIACYGKGPTVHGWIQVGELTAEEVSGKGL